MSGTATPSGQGSRYQLSDRPMQRQDDDDEENRLGYLDTQFTHHRYDSASTNAADQSTLTPATSGYPIGREDSRSPLHTPGVGEGGAAYHAQPLLGTVEQSPDPNNHRVHYPPSPQMAQQYTIPLAAPSESYTGSATSTMNGNGAYPTGRDSPSVSTHRSKNRFMPFSSSPSRATTPNSERGVNEKTGRPKNSRHNSWDLLGVGRNANGEKPEWEEFKTANASVENLRFAEGDVATNKFARLYYYLLSKSIVTRWMLYILPVLALLWIPGIVGLTAEPNATVWEVQLLWWSIWLSVLWGGFWASTAAFMMLPAVFRATIGAIAPKARAYTDVVRALGRFLKLCVWTAAMWVSFTPLVINHYIGDQAANSRSNLTTMANILFGLFLCSMVYAAEKTLIQIIAYRFHQDSYEDRIREQKIKVKALVTLYINSHDIPGRSDTLRDNASSKTRAGQLPKVAIRKAMKGLRSAVQTTTTALGNVASEMAGQSVLQTNSPANKVTAALGSANKTKQLARRLFYSFRQPGADQLMIEDVARYFPNLETANVAFQMFDQDLNGDATRDEIEMACMEIHRERLSLEASMRDLDGAVRRLDDIFLVVVFVIVVLVMAAMVTTKLTTLVTSAGTFILGLSWLIGTTMQEILGACIFLFVKHPFDVGDRVDVDGVGYVVKSMQLMSTTFQKLDGKYTFVSNNILNTKFIDNIRRSGPTSETFVFEVGFETSFDDLQALREKMILFLKDNKRDYLPVFDVTVDDIPAQGKMVLKAEIKYKSNWQQGALKVQRRNKWICALKGYLAEVKIYGPAGAGDPAPPPADPVQYTLVPWEEIQAKQAQAAEAERVDSRSPPPTFQTATANQLMDSRGVVNDPTQDVFDEHSEVNGTSVAPSRVGTPASMMRPRMQMPQPPQPAAAAASSRRRDGSDEEIEMVTPQPQHRRL